MKFKYILFAAAVSLMATSCNEDIFLDNQPQGSLSDGVIKNDNKVDLLTNAAYSALMGPNPQDWSVWTCPVTNWSYGSVRSDDAYKGGGGTVDLADVHRMEIMDVDATNGNGDSKWYHLYTSVQRCNSALRMLESMSDEQLKDRKVQIEEMKVLRGHFYFELSRLFNRIPYFEENYEGKVSDVSNVEFTRDQILEKIATTMEEAAKVLPESQPEIGRINKYIATAYAAKVNLYRAYKQDETTHKVISIDQNLLQKVVSECDGLINSGK